MNICVVIIHSFILKLSNTTKHQTFSDTSILNKSFNMSASEQDDYDPMLKDAGCKHD